MRVEKPGFKSVATVVNIDAKIDGYPVVDLPAEMIVRQRAFRRMFELEPLSVDEKEGVCQAIRKRAEAFRERTYREVNEPGTPGREAGK